MSTRAERLAAAKPEVWKVCPVCKRSWRPWAGTALQSHAKCAMSPALQDDLLGVLELFGGRGLTMKRLADDMGMSLHVLRANLEAARRRRLEGVT